MLRCIKKSGMGMGWGKLDRNVHPSYAHQFSSHRVQKRSSPFLQNQRRTVDKELIPLYCGIARQAMVVAVHPLYNQVRRPRRVKFY
jgi:hypothetical protein